MTTIKLNSFEKWHKSKKGLAVFGIVELVAAYLVGSRAIDTGSLWQYLFATVLFIGGAQNLIKGYCFLLYQRYGTFEEVSRRAGLDRRTVKKYIQEWQSGEGE